MYKFITDWLQGYLILDIQGKRLERLINLAVGQGLTIWNIKRFNRENGQLSILLEDFFQLRPLLKETECRIHIKQRSGFPFFAQAMKKRFAFVAGVFMFMALVSLLSNMIWSVEVVGNDKISEQRVLEIAEQAGVERGKFLFKLPETEALQQYMLQEMPRASWVGFKVNGTKVTIRVVEKVIPDEREALSPRHLVATKRAIIHDIFVEQGRPHVEINQWVNKGDILVSGILGNEENYEIIPSKGEVFGEVWYETEVSVPLVQEPVEYTGEFHRNDYLLLGNYSIKLWGYGEMSFSEYETEADKYYLKVGSYQLPIGWKKEVLLEKKINKIKLNQKQAIQLGKNMARQDVLSRVEDGKIKREKVLHQSLDNGKVYMKMHFAVIEEISTAKPIVTDPFENEKKDKENQKNDAQ